MYHVQSFNWKILTPSWNWDIIWCYVPLFVGCLPSSLSASSHMICKCPLFLQLWLFGISIFSDVPFVTLSWENSTTVDSARYILVQTIILWLNLVHVLWLPWLPLYLLHHIIIQLSTFLPLREDETIQCTAFSNFVTLLFMKNYFENDAVVMHLTYFHLHP